MNYWDRVADTISAEFGDLTLESAVKLIVRLGVAAIVGGVLGWQREAAGKAAGFRTHILVALGGAAFVAIPQLAGMSADGVSRILQGLITGIGFLGAGCIMKQETGSQIKGMTTAAGIWLTAGVGVAAGLGQAGAAVLLGAFGWFTLSALYRWERWIAATPKQENKA